MTARRYSSGVTLVELIVSIVVISVATVGILATIAAYTERSANQMVLHQSVAIAEAYLEEILTKEFNDPDGTNVGETRPTFDNVADYNGLTDVGARDQNNNPIAGLGAYTVTVAVVNEGLNGIAAANSLRATVTVTPPAGGAIAISGYRTNY